MAGGVVIEFSHFGDFDSFDIIRSDTPMDITALPAPLVTGLTTMAYLDSTVVIGQTYYYRAAVLRGAERLVSTEEFKVTARDNLDEYWDSIVCLLSASSGELVDYAPITPARVWSAAAGIPEISSTEKLFLDGSMSFSGAAAIKSLPLCDLGTGDYTLELTVKTSIIASNGFFFSMTKDSAYYGLEMSDSGGLKVYAPGRFDSHINPPQSIIDRWAHIALVKSGNSHKIYVDGVLLSNAVFTPVNINGATLVVGASGTEGYNRISAYIEQVRLTKGVARYTEDFLPPVMAFSEFQ